jgi:pyruvate/2-oxoglutarate dehydrogenase complex dihydrolipoamide acyltransferase (E2) component
MSTNGTAEPISLQDAAAQLGISDRSVRRYIKRLGISPEQVFTQVGRSLRIVQEDIDAIAAELSARCRASAASGQVSASPSDAKNEGSGQGADKVADRWPEGAASLPALQDAALDQLRDSIRQAVRLGIQDAIQDAPDLLWHQRPSKWLQRLQVATYALLGVTLTVCLGLAVILSYRVSALYGG